MDALFNDGLLLAYAIDLWLRFTARRALHIILQSRVQVTLILTKCTFTPQKQIYDTYEELLRPWVRLLALKGTPFNSQDFT